MLLGAIAGGPLTAQDLRADLARVAGLLATTPRLDFTVDVQVYANAGTSPVTRQSIAVHKNGSRMLYEMNGVEMLSTGDETIIADSRSRTLVVARRADSGITALLAVTDPAHADSAVHRADSTIFVGIIGGRKQYSVFSGRGLIQRVDVMLDPVTGQLRRLIYHYDPARSGGDRQVIIGYDWSATPIDDALLSEPRFITRVGGYVRGAGAYSDFRVVEASK
jgi:hypothetical protein